MDKNKINLTRKGERIIYFDIEKNCFFSVYDPPNISAKYQNIITAITISGSSSIKLISSLYSPISGSIVNSVISIFTFIIIYLAASKYIKKLESNVHFVSAFFSEEELIDLVNKSKRDLLSNKWIYGICIISFAVNITIFILFSSILCFIMGSVFWYSTCLFTPTLNLKRRKEALKIVEKLKNSGFRTPLY